MPNLTTLPDHEIAADLLRRCSTHDDDHQLVITEEIRVLEDRHPELRDEVESYFVAPGPITREGFGTWLARKVCPTLP